MTQVLIFGTRFRRKKPVFGFPTANCRFLRKKQRAA
jgi:hypothetical protein